MRKAENARLLAEEEAVAPPKAKVAPKAAKSFKAQKPAGPGAIAAGGVDVGGPSPDDQGPEEKKEVESYAATGIDNVLDLLDVVTAKTDKASVGQQAAGIERHPEVGAHMFLLQIVRITDPPVSPSAEVQGKHPSQYLVTEHCLDYLVQLHRLPMKPIRSASCPRPKKMFAMPSNIRESVSDMFIASWVEVTAIQGRWTDVTISHPIGS